MMANDRYRPLKHLPKSQWPSEDRQRFEAARRPRDVFDDSAPPCSHWSDGTWRQVETAYRRWLGFLVLKFPHELRLPAQDRITPERIKEFVAHLARTVRETSIVINLDGLLMAARIFAPGEGFDWLVAIRARMRSRAGPLDRLPRLQMPWDTLALGLSLMDNAKGTAHCHHPPNEIDYRDGLIVALLSLWPIRRRSMAALTVDRHVVRCNGTITINLFDVDTKSRRPDSFVVPAMLHSYFLHYLDVVRPGLLSKPCLWFWVSQHGGGLTGGAIYAVIRRRTGEQFGIAMGMHDFRRAAATSLAIEAPEKIGLASSLLQHANPETTGRHYNLAGNATASRRFREAMSLGCISTKPKCSPGGSHL